MKIFLRKGLSLSLLGILLLLPACAQSTVQSPASSSQEVYTERDTEYLTFDEAILRSDAAMIGRYVEKVDHETYIEYQFQVEEVLYGTVEDDTIYVYADTGESYVSELNYSYETGGEPYTPGSRYVLVLEKHTSIMYDHDRYLTIGDLLLNQDTGQYTLYSQELDFSPADLTDYICSVHSQIETVSTGDSSVTSDSYDNAVEEMVRCADYVGEVTIDALEAEGSVHNGNTYRCSVENLYSGESLVTDEDGSVLIVLQKDSVQIGESYIVGFSSVDDGSIIYMQETLTSIYDSSDADVIAEVERYISG